MIKILDKISTPKSHLVSPDLTAEQKEQLYKTMESYGANRSFTYARFFRDGFDRWELDGMTALCIQFADEHEEELLRAYTDKFDVQGEQGERVRLMRAYIAGSNANLLSLCDEVRGLRSRLFEFLAAAGMSRSTCYVRFSDGEWKPWECVGVKNICKQLAYDNTPECKPGCGD